MWCSVSIDHWQSWQVKTLFPTLRVCHGQDLIWKKACGRVWDVGNPCPEAAPLQLLAKSSFKRQEGGVSTEFYGSRASLWGAEAERRRKTSAKSLEIRKGTSDLAGTCSLKQNERWRKTWGSHDKHSHCQQHTRRAGVRKCRPATAGGEGGQDQPPKTQSAIGSGQSTSGN